MEREEKGRKREREEEKRKDPMVAHTPPQDS